MTTTTRYKRRPEHPRPVEGPAWNERLESIEAWITNIVQSDAPQTLHVGAIWGPRGSGKTSMLETLLNRLALAGLNLSLPRRDPETKNSAERRPLFAPDLLDDENGDHLFTHLLTYLQEHYIELRGQQRSLDEAIRTLTRHRYHDDFKEFDKDTGTSPGDLAEKLQDRLRDRATFSTNLRKAISEALKPGRRWFLLPIDDIDLVPQRGPELLKLLHTYLRDLPVIVLLAADREQLAEHTTRYLANSHRADRDYSLALRFIAEQVPHEDRDYGLALRFIAKQVPHEWSVPSLLPSERLAALFEPKEADGAPTFGSVLKTCFTEVKDLLRKAWSSHQKRSDAHDDEMSQEKSSPRSLDNEAPQPWGDEPNRMLEPYLPPTWRTINRTYNRLARLHEELNGSSRERALEEFRLRLGVREDLILPLLAVLVAVDEHLPEVALWDALERDPENLFARLQRLSQPLPDSPEHAPEDRLRSPWLRGRDISFARNLLTKLASLWSMLREASKDVLPSSQVEMVIDPSTPACYALSAIPGVDAAQEMRLLRGVIGIASTSTVDHIDLRPHLSGGHVTAREIQEIIADKSFTTRVTPLAHDAVIYPRAPLSLMAWLGWHTRHHAGLLTILGAYAGLADAYVVPYTDIPHSRTKPENLEEPKELTTDAPPAGIAPAPHEAMILLDIRSNPDASGRALPLLRDDTRVFPAHAYKLASFPGLVITPENIRDLLTDVCWLFRELKNSRDIRRFHLALATSNPLAFFIGRELHAFAPVELYEFDPAVPAYRWVASLG